MYKKNQDSKHEQKNVKKEIQDLTFFVSDHESSLKKLDRTHGLLSLSLPKKKKNFLKPHLYEH